MINVKLYISIFILSTSILCSGQKSIVPDKLIIQGNPILISGLLQERSSSFGRSISQYILLPLSEDLNVYHLLVDSLELEEVKEFLEYQGITVQYDHLIEYRNIPNDAKLGEQYALTMIGAFDAWTHGTGGLDIGNRAPVCAVIDDGFDIYHEDLFNNIYANNDEIPNNGIDDDDNGFIDDYYGVNISFSHQEHPIREHGTNVMGILGAEGDNSIGIAGVTWKTQLMPVSGIRTEGDIIRAYDYLYRMRKKYNETQGDQGAYIVVTNFSGGLENAFAENHQIWCNMYDLLGSVGILSISAVTNKNIDIDKIGDMPTTCMSRYLIKVSNADANGKRALSGKSKIFVDLSAPGVNILTTFTDDQYLNFSGTSAAAPHVAGLASIIYSLECETFYQMTISDPDLAAFTVKNIILGSVVKEPSFRDHTSTGGVLNMNNAIRDFGLLCRGTTGELNIDKVTYVNNDVVVDYTTDNDKDHTLYLYNLSGQKMKEITFTPVQFGNRVVILPSIHLATGIYVLSIYNQKEFSSQKIFIR